MRIVKVLGAVVAALVLLLAIGAVVVAFVFDPNDYKAAITDAVRARTGRTLTINQPLKLSFFPWLAVETGGITLGNAHGFDRAADGSPQPFATVQRAAARVKLLPLLERRVEIGTVELDGLRLDLARDAALKGNWEDLLASAEGSGGAPGSPASGGGTTVQSLSLEGIEVRDGTIEWRENTDQLRYVVSGLDLTTGAIGSRAPVDVALAFDFRDPASALSVGVKGSARASFGSDGSVTSNALKADVALKLPGAKASRNVGVRLERLAFDRDRQRLTIEGLATDSEGLHATWSAEGTALLDSPAFEGSVTLADSRLADLLAALDLAPPPAVTAGELGNVSFAARFAYRTAPEPEIRLTDVKADVLGMHATGVGTFAGSDELSGRVTIPEFAAGKAFQALLRAAVPPTVDVSALDRLAFTARFDTHLATGQAALRDLKASVLGATVTGELEAIPGKTGNVFRGSVATSRFPPEPFVKAFGKLLADGLKAGELGPMQLKTAFVFDSGADTVTAGPFEAEIFGLKGSGNLTGRHVTTAASWTGQLDVAAFSPQSLMQRFGLPKLETSDPRALTRASVQTKLTVDAKGGRFENIVLALDDSKITGDFTLDGFDQPKYGFALVIDKVNADRYLPPTEEKAKPGQSAAGDISLPENNTMRLDGTVQVGSLQLANLQFAAVGSRIVIGDGNMQLDNARARLYGGDFAGSFGVHAKGGQPGLTLDGKATKLELKPLIEALTGEPANVSGRGDFEIELSGTGRKIVDNLRTAGGKVSFAMRDGAIKGFNLGSTLCAAYNLKQGLPMPSGQPKETAYQVIQGTATVTGGVATSQDLLGRTTFMDITGRGTLGLAEQRLDYDVDAKLTGKIAIAGCQTMDDLIGSSIPFNIKGTVTDPSITPDFSKIVRNRVREEVHQRLQDKLRDRLKDLIH
jgi:uncharacterized protein involved in outer membrane biogenesis